MSWLRDVDRWLCDRVLPHEAAYHATAFRVTNNPDLARDIVQDVYAEILAGEGWRRAINPRAFVLRIVYCRSVDWVRSQTGVPLQALPPFEGLNYADASPDAHDTFSSKEELELVMELLDELPVRCRQVLTMRRLEELPPREISKRLGIDLVTVRRHLARGVAQLIDKLASRGTVRRLPQATNGNTDSRNNSATGE